jgi:putative addiction module component (TIGR02574 family)
MPMTLDQIVQETRQWPEDVVAELIDRILLARHGIDDSAASLAWQGEIRRRVEDIHTGRDPGVSGEEVMSRARKIIGR